MKRLLFVEDQPSMREAGRDIAIDLGYDAYAVGSISEAFSFIRTRPSLHVLITDIHLNAEDTSDENRDGETIAQIARREHGNLAIIATSSRYEETELSSDEESPFDMFSSKDWLKDDDKSKSLFEKIENYSSQYKSAKIDQKKRVSSTLSTPLQGDVTASELFATSDVKNVRLMVIDNSDIENLTSDANHVIRVPIPIWVKECRYNGEDFTYLEVYKFSNIAAVGNDLRGALISLVAIFEKIKSAATEDHDISDLEDAGIKYEDRRALVSYLTS